MLISGREDASSRVAPQELCIFTPVPAVICWGQEFFYDLTQFTEGKLLVGQTQKLRGFRCRVIFQLAAVQFFSDDLTQFIEGKLLSHIGSRHIDRRKAGKDYD